MISRRAFCGSVAGAVLAARFAAEAQQPGKVYRIGFLGVQRPTTPEALRLWETFPQGLRERGWVEGQNIVIEYRAAGASLERAGEQAAELIQLKVDVIVAAGAGVVAAAQATKTIPVVSALFTDPVAFGLVASLARPGGNVTGLSEIGADLNAKRFSLLKEAVPGATRMAVLGNPQHRLYPQMRKDVEAAAQSLRVEARFWEVRDPKDLEAAFREMSTVGAKALFVLEHPLWWVERARLIDLAARHRLPALYEFKAFAESGGFMAYGADYADMLRRAGYYVDKILRGAKPADLPMEQPTKFELAINLKTAKALGLTIPPSLLLRADEVIQ